MKIKILEEEEMFQLYEVSHNPPVIRNEKDDDDFQEEIKKLWDKLVAALARFGVEDDYGDYALGPCLRDFPTVIPRAPHLREFSVSIISEEFFYSNYLQTLHQFISTGANNYLIRVERDYPPSCVFRLFLTSDLAQVYCPNKKELERVTQILSKL